MVALPRAQKNAISALLYVLLESSLIVLGSEPKYSPVDRAYFQISMLKTSTRIRGA